MEWLSWELLRYPGWVLAVLLVIIGLVGTVLPAIPGVPILLLGLVLIAWIDGFNQIGPLTLVLMGLLAAISVIIDFLATAEGARRFGAGWPAILGASIGLLVGLFFGIPGLLLGPFLGAVLGHLLSRARIDDSMRAGVGATLGVVIGTLSKVVIAFVLLIWFGLAWVF